MSTEGLRYDKKSLEVAYGNLKDVARDCVAFANASGGVLDLGIEDEADAPPPSQAVDTTLAQRVVKRIHEQTVNVTVGAEICTHPEGGQYLRLTVPRAVAVASTSDGRYYLRDGDASKPVTGDDVLRLATERPTVAWEALPSAERAVDADRAAATRLAAALRASERVKASVKEKSDPELLAHYGLVAGDALTHLGVLMIGTPTQRLRLGTAPIVQVLKHDERGEKVSKQVWDDHALSPVELVDAVWRAVPDFRESYEIPEGLLRTTVPAYDEAVVRELLVNALVHRPYTQRGDVFLELHPDRLQITNPGRLPLGVTPQNILHMTRRRNEGLARVFHDLGLMEREGSGFDLMYDRLLSSGRPAPEVSEGSDSTRVVVRRRILQPGVLRLMAEADRQHALRQRERIVLGLVAQSEGLLATELARSLELGDTAELRGWLDRLLELGLLEQAGRTKGTRYYVPPDLLRAAGLDDRTTLSRIQPHRLRALILEDLSRFPASSRPDIQRRIGPEISEGQVKRALNALIEEGAVTASGERRWRTYGLTTPGGKKP